MRARLSSVFIVILSILITACGGGSPTSPGGDGSTNTFATATVDGQPFTATELVALTGSNDGRGYVSVTALNGCAVSSTSILLLASKIDGGSVTTGVYSTSRSIQIPLGPGVSTTARELTTTIMQNDQTWMAPATGGSGTLTITSITSTHVEGTFSFVGAATTGGATGTRSASGSFRARIADVRIC
jgi:hypothetical protein